MKRNPIRTRALVALLLVAVASASLAPAALADRDHGGRRGHPRTIRVHRGPWIGERHSDAGAFVGFLGGLVVGSILSTASSPAPPPPPAYVYEDPFCHRSFASLEAYEYHLGYHRHPREADVIEMRSGRQVDALEWRDGGWCSRYDHPRYEEWDE
jgi:hypothetical protein